jgi:hypothetical protein
VSQPAACSLSRSTQRSVSGGRRGSQDPTVSQMCWLHREQMCQREEGRTESSPYGSGTEEGSLCCFCSPSTGKAWDQSPTPAEDATHNHCHVIVTGVPREGCQWCPGSLSKEPSREWRAQKGRIFVWISGNGLGRREAWK